MDPDLDLNECYQGMDQFMREVMRVASMFEEWACKYVAFEELDGVWPYLLEERFGEECIEVVNPDLLMRFDWYDCFRVAMRMRLPMWVDGRYPHPLLLEVENPVSNSGFEMFRIQAVRNAKGSDEAVPFVFGDEADDESFCAPRFVVYGVRLDGSSVAIFERGSYGQIVELLCGLFPGIVVPKIRGSL
nr:hypothetical protein [Verrucomicrobiota bacterium JB025]